MKKLIAAAFCVLNFSAQLLAQDVTRLQPIGAVKDFTKTETGIILNCVDSSQVQLSVLASDLIRVRASFGKALPARDHSWAIAKNVWEKTDWSVKESADLITVATAEVEVVIHRSPLLIDFRSAKTHRLVNADERPMAYDAKGV